MSTTNAPIPGKRGGALFTREIALAALTVITVAIFSKLYPRSFLSFDNFASVVRNLAFEGILACGMLLLMVAGSFDLSVGAMASMAGVIAGWLMKQGGWPVPIAVLAALTFAVIGGLLNGLVVAKVRVNALITTLGTMGIFKGIAILIGGPGITFLPETFTRLGQAEFLGIQSPVWLLLVLAIAGHYGLAHTRFFRQYYYIGSNVRAALYSGLPVERLQVLAFMITGLLAGVAGIVTASRMATAGSSIGNGAELGAITAVILGGASLQGGRGTIWGAMLGVFFMALMKNVLLIAQVRSEWQDIVLGVVLVLAVGVDTLFHRKQAG